MIKEPTKTELLKTATMLLRSVNDECMATTLLELMIKFGHAEKMLSVPKIDNYKAQMRLGLGIPDFVLFHADGGISIVEVKADKELRSIVAGIGQLFFYESMIPDAFKGKKDVPTYIRKILAVPIDFDKCDKINKACELSGVSLVNLTTHEKLKRILKRYKDGA